LYAGEVYVVAEQIQGLASGLYYYAVEQHQLIQLRVGSLLAEVGRSVERPTEIENAAAAVLLTNVFGRYTRRYANRGYRYALIDSGHIGENLRLAASSFGFADSSALRFWDDQLNDLLGIDGRSEAVCAIHAVGRGGAPADRTPAYERRLIEAQRSGSTPLDIPIIERFHQATKLVPEISRTAVNAVPLSSEPVLSNQEGLELPKSQPSQISVATAIRKRRSAEAFTRPAVTLGDLSFVLEAADGNQALKRTTGVQVFAIANRVAGLEPGVYRYAPKHHELIPVRKADLHGRLVGACLGQTMAGSAAVGFVMAARLESVPSPLGDRRYRDLLLESGAIAQRIYLAAEAVGLVARNLAAFIDDRFNRLLDLDSRGLSALHLTMLGHGR
jgi:SagB-type dehydrogenase family enzyme